MTLEDETGFNPSSGSVCVRTVCHPGQTAVFESPARTAGVQDDVVHIIAKTLWAPRVRRGPTAGQPAAEISTERSRRTATRQLRARTARCGRWHRRRRTPRRVRPGPTAPVNGVGDDARAVLRGTTRGDAPAGPDAWHAGPAAPASCACALADRRSRGAARSQVAQSRSPETRSTSAARMVRDGARPNPNAARCRPQYALRTGDQCVPAPAVPAAWCSVRPRRSASPDRQQSTNADRRTESSPDRLQPPRRPAGVAVTHRHQQTDASRRPPMPPMSELGSRDLFRGRLVPQCALNATAKGNTARPHRE